MTSLNFAESSPADDADIVALWRKCGLTRPWNDPFADIAFARSQDNAAMLIGSDKAGTLVTSVMVGHDGHRGWVYYLAADPDNRRAGLGRKAMAQAENWLRDRGIRKLNILVRSDNADVLKFYRALGFGDDHCAALSKRLDGRNHREHFPDAKDWC